LAVFFREDVEMPIKQKKNKIEKVRIAASLNADFDGFFSALKLRILHNAVLRASTRGTETDNVRLVAEDLVKAAQEAFPKAGTELNKALSPRELRHVRRAS
jgi:hypothetical protein